MLQLEYISIAGFMFVLMLLFTMIVEACKAGLPAIGNGEFSIVGFTDLCARSLPHASALLARPRRTCPLELLWATCPLRSMPGPDTNLIYPLHTQALEVCGVLQSRSRRPSAP